jgi:hypothetical protein
MPDEAEIIKARMKDKDWAIIASLILKALRSGKLIAYRENTPVPANYWATHGFEHMADCHVKPSDVIKLFPPRPGMSAKGGTITLTRGGGA